MTNSNNEVSYLKACMILRKVLPGDFPQRRKEIINKGTGIPILTSNIGV